MLHNKLLQHGLNGEEFDDPERIVEDDDNNHIAENAFRREGEIARNFVANFFVNNN